MTETPSTNARPVRLPAVTELLEDTSILDKPDERSWAVRQGRAGERVKVVGFEDGFAVLSIRLRKGYVREGAVSLRASECVPVEHLAGSRRLELRRDAPVLDRPDESSPVLRPARAGERLMVTGFENGFAVVNVYLRKGYVREDAFAPLRSSSVRTTTGSTSTANAATYDGALMMRATLPWVSLVIAIAVAISAVMPWEHFSFIVSASVTGTDLGQGKAVLVLGVFAAGIAFIRGLGARSIVTSSAQFGVASASLGTTVYVLHGVLNSCGELQQVCASLVADGLYFAVISAAALTGVRILELGYDLRAG